MNKKKLIGIIQIIFGVILFLLSIMVFSSSSQVSYFAFRVQDGISVIQDTSSWEYLQKDLNFNLSEMNNLMAISLIIISIYLILQGLVNAKNW